MDTVFIAPTPTSPEVDFRFAADVLWLKGESFPENAAAFYLPVIEQLRAYLAQRHRATIVVNVALAYFNSSSTKMLFTLFDALDQAAQAGNVVELHWYFDAEDETIQEFGEELRLDFQALKFFEHPELPA
ncbi:DUF1987 domain-containing protein [Pseudomonas oryzihabitans]|uniref:DUF1987 domain-containing protein n=1 Tax=Pseudomonas oryzihabitans TaxID=47885 RepID=UPI002865FFF1|nr:DUF1987 domain-containing protein [Pseudomonas psychrotolerans]MDR6679325.1 putative DNA-binding transcriptional regulator YafY [Pseudomonas psychrotolerans]